MTPRKHTPGPWEYSTDNARVYHEESNICVARCAGDTFDANSFAECLANAWLIAAAPELLEALRSLLLAPGQPCAELAARAAIAKAEGRES